MPKPGDRVVVEGTKIGGARREGILVSQAGSLIKVRWNDGGETMMAPGAGAVTFLPGKAKATKAAPAKPKPKAKAAAPKAKAKAPVKGKKKK
jgi:uncharacterized protein DUF1918